MADISGLPPARSLPLLNQATNPDGIPGQVTIFSNNSGVLQQVASNGTVTALGGGGGGSYKMPVGQGGMNARNQTGGYFVSLNGSAGADVLYYVPAGVTGNMTNVTGYFIGASAGGTVTIALWKNGVPTAISQSYSITTGNTTVALTGSVAAAPGDQFAIAVTTATAVALTGVFSALLTVP